MNNVHEISMTQGSQAFLARLFAKQFAGNVQLSDLIARFHPRPTHQPYMVFALFDESELILIIDALGDAFMSVGLQSDSEPNGLGLQIEGFVDLLNGPLID